jgi:hypothetical protein
MNKYEEIVKKQIAAKVGYNKVYREKKRQQGIAVTQFICPIVLKDQVRQFIKEQSAILNTTKEKV